METDEKSAKTAFDTYLEERMNDPEFAAAYAEATKALNEAS